MTWPYMDADPLGLLPEFEDDYEDANLLKSCAAVLVSFVGAWAALIALVVAVVRWAQP